MLDRVGALPWEQAGPATLALQPGEMFAALGCSDQVSAEFRKHRETTDPYQANAVAWHCAWPQGPSVISMPR